MTSPMAFDSDGTLFAIVPAAGIGSRMNQNIPKQYLPLMGKAIIEHTIEKLLSIDAISSVTVALQAGDTYWPSLAIAKHPKVNAVIGGATRSDSVLAALKSLPQSNSKDSSQYNNRWALVHDAARPCVSVNDINHLLATLRNQTHGGILAVPVVDTLKRVTAGQHKGHSEDDSTGDKVETVNRESLYQAHTPQMFSVDSLIKAIESAHQQGFAITDEASAIELAGFTYKLVASSPQNIKITVDDDLALAEYYLRKSGL